MSWPTWHTTAPPMPGVVSAPSMQSTVLPNTINPAPALLPPPTAATIPSGMHYSPEQWAQMQQQNWQQWAQWQQQYQQWHQQYGAEYQKSMNALSASTTNTAVPPPPPNENKPPPPPPPDDGIKSTQYNTIQHRPSTGYSTFPPPSQQYLNGPPPSQYPDQSQTEWQTSTNKRSVPQNDEYECNKRQMIDKQNQPSRSGNSWQNQPPPNCQSQAQKVLNLEELTEAEKKFDKEFAAWEAQFNKWKEQNANHPDKTQYLEYEKKWESWRNSLLDRREQMRKKRIALQASMSATTTKAATMLPQQSFKQPPPLQQVYSHKKDQLSDDFSKPPPTQNNEPLLFKPSANYSDESIQNESSDIGNAFLKSSSPTPGGIPGLDLVKESPSQDNIGDDPSGSIEVNSQTISKGPDLDAISKGINTILGDTKLLNMLSMVSQKQNLSAGMSIDTQLKFPETHQPPPKPSAPIPSLLNMPIQQRPNLEKSDQNYDDYEAYGSGQRETVNNFDDQTRMSFSNGPNEQELNYINNSVNSTRSDKSNNFRRFADDADKRHMFGNNPNNEYTFSRNNSFENPSDTHSDNFRNMNGPVNNRDSIVASRDTLSNANFGQTYSLRHNDKYENHNQYAEDVIDEQWNEEDEYDKYHDMFNEGEQSLETPSKNMLPLSSQNDQPVQDEPLFVPEVVVDYEHKSLKVPEPEISLDMIRMFDYRHKPVNRIPYPQRPIWLSASLRNIKQFDPLGTGRFSNRDRTHFERESTRYGGERIEPFDRQTGFEDGDYKSNDDTFRFSRDRYPENRNDWSYTDIEFNRERERTRQKDPNHRQVNLEMSRNRYSEEISDTVHIDKKLELEDLSDEEWIDDKNYSTKDSLKFSPPRKRDARSPEISLRGNTTNTGSSTTLNQNTTLDNLINPPGRHSRPQRIVVILRGPPGSGKTYLARVIKDREVENGGSAPRILSLDDYFMVEHEKEVMEDGKAVRIKEMTYEYEAEMEESYRQSLIKAFKKTITDGYFHFVVVDNVNQKVKNFGEMWSFAKQNGFQVYICQLDLDPEVCTRQNIHHRSESFIEDCISGWEPTPSHHPLVDATSFLQSQGSITEVEMEEADQSQDQKDNTGEPGSMVSTNLSGPLGRWKNSSNWTTNGKSLVNPQNPVRKGFDGPTWKNRNNRGR